MQYFLLECNISYPLKTLTGNGLNNEVVNIASVGPQQV